MDKIEILIAWNDGTWTTEIVEIGPGVDKNDDNSVNRWLKYCLMPLKEYGDAVLMTTYNTDPEGEGKGNNK